MNKNRKFIWLGLIGALILASGLFAACSANIPADTAPKETGSLESDNQTESSIENSEEDLDVVSSIDEIFDKAPSSNNTSSDALPADSEVDANGVPIGFTENGNPYRGNPDAPVVIEEFSDFQ
jgi:protein-disulfide isomerase